MATETCPVNGCELRGPEIPTEYLEKGLYGPWKPEDGPQYYSSVVGVEIRGLYDGVAYWSCPSCGAHWHRWDGPDEYSQRIRAEVEKAWAGLDVPSPKRYTQSTTE